MKSKKVFKVSPWICMEYLYVCQRSESLSPEERNSSSVFQFCPYMSEVAYQTAATSTIHCQGGGCLWSFSQALFVHRLMWMSCRQGRAVLFCSGCTLCTELCCPWPCSCQWAATPQSRCRRIVAALRREVLPQPSEEVQALPGLPYEVVMWSVHVRSSVTTSRYL